MLFIDPTDLVGLYLNDSLPLRFCFVSLLRFAPRSMTRRADASLAGGRANSTSPSHVMGALDALRNDRAFERRPPLQPGGGLVSRKSAAPDYAVSMPAELKLRLDACRDSARDAIQQRLQQVASSASAMAAPPRLGSSYRFYIAENVRVAYQVDSDARTVTVLELRAE